MALLAMAATLEARPAPAAATAALDAIYRAEVSYVWSSFVHLGVPRHEVEDLVHDLFVQVYRSLDRYDLSRPIRPWLFGIAFNLASNHFRSARVRREVPVEHLEAAAPAASDDIPLEERMSGKERYALLCQALDALDLDRRAVFVMHELDEIPMPEIAETIGIPLNTAYSRLRLARSQVAATARRLLLVRGAGGDR